MISDSLSNKSYSRIHFEEIDSTNEEAKRRFLKGERASLLISADYQSAGKGRNGRSFYSPKDTGIYFSYLCGNVPKEEFRNLIFITTAAAVFVTDELIRITGADAGIKWVNDVYVNGKKVCGILAEAMFAQDCAGIVTGIGINLTTEVFPDEIREIAASVGSFREEELKKIKEEILLSVGERFAEFFERFDDEKYRLSILEEYRKYSLVIGKEVSFYEQSEQPVSAEAVGIEEDGGLLVRLKSGEMRKLDSGEIHLKLE